MIGTSFSSWKYLLCDVPKGSILGQLLFNIVLCDLFLLIGDVDIASYAESNTPYIVGHSIDQIYHLCKMLQPLRKMK